MVSYCRDRYGNVYQCYNSAWYSWGRWVLFGAIVLGAILIFFLFSCLTARRRRKLGRKPIYGTGWAAQGPYNAQSQPAYNPNYNQQTPVYSSTNQQPQGGYYGGQNQSYFGGQQTGISQPNNSYQPPPGPPPSKVY